MQIRKEIFWQVGHDHTTITPPITHDQTTDVVVVGGGMAGLAAAERLSFAGKQVLLLEQEYIGAGASGKSSGMISQDSELGLTDLIENLGPEKARLLWDFVGKNLEHIRSNILTHHFDCGYQAQDYLCIANSERAMKKIHAEAASRRSFGYESTMYNATTIKTVVGGEGYAGGLRYPGTFAINSFRYAQAMKQLLIERGVKIFEQSKVTAVGNGKVTVNGVTVLAPKIVVCIDHFLPSLARLSRSVFHVESYIAVTTPLSESEIAQLFPSGPVMANDSDIVYQYFRLTSDRRLLIGGGDYRTTYAYSESKTPEHILPKLTTYLKEKFPYLQVTPQCVWPGLLGVTKDLLPIAGRDRDDASIHYVAGATGLAWATGLGRYVAEQILEDRHDYDDLFDPYRKFPFDPLMQLIQPLLTTPMTFGLSHAFVKYLRQIF